jgi:YggT family protein
VELPLLKTLIEVVMMFLNFAMIMILASIVVSWVGADPSNQLVMMLRAVTEPVFRPFRRFTSKIPGPIDWAPMIVALLIQTAQVLLKNVLEHMIRTSAGGPGLG